MALRLSRDLRSQTEAENGFDLDGIENKEYNLDEIEENKKRKSNRPIAIHVSETKNDQAGSLSLKDTAESLAMSNIEYENILLVDDNLPKNNGYKNTGSSMPNPISLKRPVVIWEDGSEDNRVNPNIKTVYDEVYELEMALEKLNKKLEDHENLITSSIKIDLMGNLITERNKIPTVGAVHDYLAIYRDNLIKYDYIDGQTFGLRNARISMNNDGNYTAKLTSEKFGFIENEINEFTLVVGG